MKKLLPFLLVFVAVACSQQPDTAVVTGRVTDYEGNPLDSVTVSWLNPAFNGHYYTLTDADGRYKIRIPKGRYASSGGLNMAAYCVTGSVLPPEEQRLEYWHWNMLVQNDTTYDFRYHRLEVYGVNAFQIQGAAPGYTIYFRPMSLTRHQRWVQAGKPAGCAALAPPLDSARIEVMIDGNPVRIKMAQEVQEYFSDEESSNAYLLFVDRPEHDRPVKTFRIVMEDLGTGDRGEGAYTLEEKAASDYVWPEGEIDATYKE